MEDAVAFISSPQWTQLEPTLRELDLVRQRTLRRVALFIGVVLVLTLGIAALILAAGATPEFLVIPLVIGAVIGIAGYVLMTGGYRATFKRQIIGPLVATIHETLQYEPDGSISRQEFVDSRIFTRDPDRVRGEDLVEGTIGATAVRFSELHAEYRTTSGSGSDRQTRWHTIFRGMFFLADFNKQFNGVTIVRPDTAERFFGWVGQTLQSWNSALSGLEVIRLEDPEFEQAFVVYGSDQVEARYLLSTSLMRRILDYREATGRDVALSFVNTQIHVAVPDSGNLFEPPLLRSCVDPTLIESYVDDVQLATGIVEAFNLNLRIWNKP